MDEVRALLLHSVSHQLLLGALGADDVLPVRDEALPHHAGLAGRADEAVVVPVAALERDEPGASDSSDRFAARRDRFENSSPKQSAQYGLSSLEVKRCPARDFWQ